MRASDLRRLVRESELDGLAARIASGGDLPGVFFRLSRGFAPYVAAFRLEPQATERLARLASDIALAILAWESRTSEDRDLTLADAASAGWRRRADARERLERERAWLDPRVAGSLAGVPEATRKASPRWLDGSIACEALLVAVRELGNELALAAYRQAAEFARHGDREAEFRARAAIRRLVPSFVANAIAAGMKREDAKAAALAAAERLVGQAVAPAPSAFRLAAAAVCTLPSGSRAALSGTAVRQAWDARRGPAAGPADDGGGRLIAAVRALNDWRARTLDAAHKDSAARRFGAAAIGATYGFAHGWKRPKALSVARRQATVAAGPEGGVVIDGLRPVRLDAEKLARFRGLALDAALARLAQLAEHRRETSGDRRRYAHLRDALAESLHGREVARLSFADWAGLPQADHETAAIDDGGRLWWAAPRGRHQAVRVVPGVRGRRFVCRALADAHGRLVGYAGYDALSREFHDEPHYALYDLAGRRVGRLHPAEGGGHVALRGPHPVFMTAPESLALAA